MRGRSSMGRGLNAMGLALAVLACAGLAAFAVLQRTVPEIRVTNALRWVDPEKSAFMAVAHAGNRLVMVGEHGIVLLSDDGGRSFRQARALPIQSTLTAVYFADSTHGWSVGQWGA